MDAVAVPTVINEVVYVNARDDLYAFDAHTGEKLWQRTFFDIPYSYPAVSNGILYIGSGDGVVYALNASSGRTIWDNVVGIPSAGSGQFYGVFSAPTVANGTVYIGSQNTKLYAFDALFGGEKRSYKTGYLIVRCTHRC
jgi:outer membrane protein assembly factor BamB